jgi:hypothetical protein
MRLTVLEQHEVRQPQVLLQHSLAVIAQASRIDGAANALERLAAPLQLQAETAGAHGLWAKAACNGGDVELGAEDACVQPRVRLGVEQRMGAPARHEQRPHG